jgi:tetratricopeptide (TPR) repeat protein
MKLLWGLPTIPKKTATKAHDLAIKATRLDEKNEYAHWALGISCWGVNELKESIAALKRALELNPNCSVARGSLGTALSLIGQVDEAIANSEIAIRSNPRDPSIFFRFTVIICLSHYLAKRHEESIEWADKAVQRMPTWYFGYFLLIANHVRLGGMNEAKKMGERCLNVIPDISTSQLSRIPLDSNVEMEQFRDSLLKAGLPE